MFDALPPYAEEDDDEIHAAIETALQYKNHAVLMPPLHNSRVDMNDVVDHQSHKRVRNDLRAANRQQMLRKKPAVAPKKSSPLVAEGEQGDKKKGSPKVAKQGDEVHP